MNHRRRPARPARNRPPKRKPNPARPVDVDPARLAAVDTLRAVRERDAYANLALPALLQQRQITGRDAALATELTALGGDVTETDDGLEIRPAPLHGGRFHTYADHRMAHAAVIAGLAVPGVLVEDIATTAKTFPGFARAWSSLAGG